jgi:ATP-binding cassette subfamily F protein 3
MLNLFSKADDQEMRSFLGKFQIQGVDAIKPMFLLSGGQKSRVAFASLAYQKPHVIIMDERKYKVGRPHLSLMLVARN